MTGEAGANTFVFTRAAESTPGSKTHDVITDFHPGEDHIDLSAFDANSLTSKQDSFIWIDSAQFHHTAGELRYSAGLLQADTNGDGRADFEVVLQNSVALHQSDFFLA